MYDNDEDSEFEAGYLAECELAEREARLHELDFNSPTYSYDFQYAEYGEPA